MGKKRNREKGTRVQVENLWWNKKERTEFAEEHRRSLAILFFY
jgi:DNA mismatch repair ATPase MutL